MLKNNTRLLLILGALVAVFLLVRFLKSEKNVRTFKSELFTLDTAAIGTMKLYPAAEQGEEISFAKSNNSWTVSKSGITSVMEAGQINAMLEQLLQVKPQRLAARGKNKWKQFQVDDSAGTRVLVTSTTGEAMVDVIVGKTTYKQVQPQGQQQQFRGQQQPQIVGLSYLRNKEDEETYATEGFLQMAFNRPFDSFRDKRIAAINGANVRNITVQTPAGSNSFTKGEAGWMIVDQPIDSASMVSWLSSLASLQGQAIDDAFNPSGNPDYAATFAGDNMDNIRISAYSTGADFRIGSSENEGVWFVSDSSGVWKNLFGGIGE